MAAGEVAAPAVAASATADGAAPPTVATSGAGAGAATAAPAAEAPASSAANPADPFEGFNRKVFGFNEAVDDAVLKPVAKAYKAVVPELVRTGVGNVLGNFSDAWSAVNQLLQGKVQFGLEMGMRVAMNSVFGLGGVLDPASEAGLEKRSEDFGQTLGVWGIRPGPYIMLPILGPSAVRETFALPVDYVASPSNFVSPADAQIGLTVLRVVDTRASLLGATSIVEGIALDKYSFIRDAYIARRRSLVYDGDPPELPEDPASAEPAASAPK